MKNSRGTEWRRELERLRRRRDALKDHQYDALVAMVNSPFMIAGELDEALDLLEEIYNMFKERCDRHIGNQRQNATLSWMAAVNHNRILDDFGL